MDRRLAFFLRLPPTAAAGAGAGGATAGAGAGGAGAGGAGAGGAGAGSAATFAGRAFAGRAFAGRAFPPDPKIPRSPNLFIIVGAFPFAPALVVRPFTPAGTAGLLPFAPIYPSPRNNYVRARSSLPQS